MHMHLILTGNFYINEILMNLLVVKAQKTRLKFEIIFITRKSRLIYKLPVWHLKCFPLI